VLIFYAWTAVIGISILLMYVATSQDWFGQYWIGVVFGLIGIAACLVLTLTPTHRRRVTRPTRESRP
jgi:UDP-GlcNAc:undecaprenyl-phosphate/decaprenyl-phosphate GlcNAc-1-phosphate transferase